jgi:ADP-ribose pyrophosphatase YjhB (NUDIX family)
MGDIAMNGGDLAVPPMVTPGGHRAPAAAPPPGMPHDAAAVCISGDRILLVSSDQRWGLPGGRPQPHEGWAERLRREVTEEACAQVTAPGCLGTPRGVCVRGPQAGLVLVRSLWRVESGSSAGTRALR